VPAFIVSVVGVIVTVTGGKTVTVAVADLVGSATLVAVTETASLTVNAGAVYSPVLVILPFEADQTTAVLVVFATFAVNCWVRAENTLGCAGETETCTAMLASAEVDTRTNPARTTIRLPNRVD
jgi:hypothetical protein